VNLPGFDDHLNFSLLFSLSSRIEIRRVLLFQSMIEPCTLLVALVVSMIAIETESYKPVVAIHGF